MDIDKGIIVIGLLFDIWAVYLLLTNEGLNLSQKKAREAIPTDVLANRYRAGVTGEEYKNTKEEIIHRIASRKNRSEVVSANFIKAYRFLLLGFLLQIIGVCLS